MNGDERRRNKGKEGRKDERGKFILVMNGWAKEGEREG